MLGQCEKIINEEEAEDTQLRQQHGAKFNRPPSSSVNGQYKQQIFDYKGKIEMASATDVQIKQKFEGNTAGFALLGKSRVELGQSIPQNPNAGAVAGNPAVVAVKESLDKLDEIKLAKEKVVNDGIAMIDAHNAVEKLMEVHS